MKKQSGFATLELILIVVVLAGIGVVGYEVWHRHNMNTMNMGTTTTSTPLNYASPTVSTPPAPQIQTSSDLNSAMQALNQTSISSSNTDSSQLSTQTSSF